MAPAPPGLFSAVAETTRGRLRKLNEDAAGVRNALGLFIVCDGLGGLRDGAVASRMTVQLVLDHVDARGLPETAAGAGAVLVEAIESANEAVYCAGHAQHPGQPLRPMGTTLVALWLVHGHAIVAHAGDSRCYRMRGDTFVALTRDHRVENDPELARRLDASRPGFSREHRKLLTRFIGHAHRMTPAINVTMLRPHDRFLLCSDGLTAVVSDRQIARILRASPSSEDAASTLVRVADERGGPDNTTVVVATPRPLS